MSKISKTWRNITMSRLLTGQNYNELPPILRIKVVPFGWVKNVLISISPDLRICQKLYCFSYYSLRPKI